MKFLFPLLCLPLFLAISFQYKENLKEFIKSDTIKVTSVGINNKMKIDSITLNTSLNNDTVYTPIIGEISQTGENNQVEINSCDTTSQQIKQKVTIKQTGKSNSVKINSK